MTASTDEPVLRMYTVYRDPIDLPGVRWAVREFVISSRGNGPQAARLLGTAITLELARLLIPDGADVCIARSPDDDPVIVETWI